MFKGFVSGLLSGLVLAAAGFMVASVVTPLPERFAAEAPPEVRPPEATAPRAQTPPLLEPVTPQSGPDGVGSALENPVSQEVAGAQPLDAAQTEAPVDRPQILADADVVPVISAEPGRVAEDSAAPDEIQAAEADPAPGAVSADLTANSDDEAKGTADANNRASLPVLGAATSGEGTADPVLNAAGLTPQGESALSTAAPEPGQGLSPTMGGPVVIVIDDDSAVEDTTSEAQAAAEEPQPEPLTTLETGMPSGSEAEPFAAGEPSDGVLGEAASDGLGLSRDTAAADTAEFAPAFSAAAPGLSQPVAEGLSPTVPRRDAVPATPLHADGLQAALEDAGAEAPAALSPPPVPAEVGADGLARGSDRAGIAAPDVLPLPERGAAEHANEEGQDAPVDAAVSPDPPGMAAVEPSRDLRSGRLPQIGGAPATDGPPGQTPGAGEASIAPALARNARAFDNPENKPPFVILLRDTGDTALDLSALAASDLPMTLIIDPTRPGAADRAALWREAGQEVAVLSSALPKRATPGDVEVTLEALDRELPQALAVVEAGGAEAAIGRDLAGALVPGLKARGFGMVTWDAGLKQADQVARREGLPAARIFRDLDAKGEAAPVIRRYLDRAAFKAQQDGHVLVIGDLRPETLAAVHEWSLEGRVAGLAVAPLSAVLAPKR